MSSYGSGGGHRQANVPDALREHRTRIKNLESRTVGTDIEWEDVGSGALAQWPILGWYFATTPSMYIDNDAQHAPDWSAIDYTVSGGDATGVGVVSFPSGNAFATVSPGTSWLLAWSCEGAKTWPVVTLGLVSPFFGDFLGFWFGIWHPIQMPVVDDTVSHPYPLQVMAMGVTFGHGSLMMFDQTGGTGLDVRCNFFAVKLHADRAS